MKQAESRIKTDYIEKTESGSKTDYIEKESAGKKFWNVIFTGLGLLCFGLGAVGAVLPVLPTTPFLLAAAFFFARGSQRFHHWFVATNLYKRYIRQAVKHKAMEKKAKRNMLITLAILFTVGFVFSPVFAKVIIVVVAALHFYYFIFRVKTVEDLEYE